MAGVVTSVVGLPWQVVTGGAFNSGPILNGTTQPDGRAYSSKLIYISAGINLQLWLNNTSGTNAPITTGNNGAAFAITKVG